MKIDIILCEKADDDLRNYINVFDEITLEDHQRFSFTAVCNVKYEEDRTEEIIIHFFLTNDKDGKVMALYLSEVSIVRTDEDLELDEETFKVEFKNIPILEKGKMHLIAVRNDNMKNTGIELGKQIFITGTPVGDAEFIVK